MTKLEINSLKKLPDKLKLGETSIIREEFMKLIEEAEKLIEENENLIHNYHAVKTMADRAANYATDKFNTINEIHVHPDTIDQLESLIENAKSFIQEDEPDSIWHKDVEVLTNTLEIIKSVLAVKGINPDDLRKPQPGSTLFDYVEFKPGQAVMYRPTDHQGNVYKEKPGIVKRMAESGRAAFVWYNSGCTAACTPVEFLHESPVTLAHTQIHHGCVECLTGDPEAIMELLLDQEVK